MGNQDKRESFISTLKRKIVTAILSSLILPCIFLIGDVDMNLFLVTYYLNFMFVSTYGVITSFISDLIGNKISENPTTREVVAFLFHCFFGLAMLLLSIVPAISFYIIDRLLRKVNVGWIAVTIGLLAVAVPFFISINIS